MKKTIVSLFILTLCLSVANQANALCLQCPEIQKELKKEIKLDKAQKEQIKTIKKEMKSQINAYQKEYAINQKKINKILDADFPDIAKMMDVKKENSQIRLNIMQTKRESYSRLFEVYTEEQQETAKRILSENTEIKTKGNCEFCDNKNVKERSRVRFQEKSEN